MVFSKSDRNIVFRVRKRINDEQLKRTSLLVQAKVVFFFSTKNFGTLHRQNKIQHVVVSSGN